MIDATVTIGEEVEIGQHVVIEKNVIIGNNVTIGHHAVIKEGTVIGNNVIIRDLTTVGQFPFSNKKMARKPAKELPPLLIGDDVKIGSNCVIFRGSILDEGTLIGDMASIRECVEIGKDSIIGRNAMVENNTLIGERVTIQTSSYVTAHMVIEDDVFVGPRFSSSNDKHMRKRNTKLIGPILKAGAKIGNNASLLPGVIIGENAIVGAGAVVTKNVKPNDIVVGNPARAIRVNL